MLRSILMLGAIFLTFCVAQSAGAHEVAVVSAKAYDRARDREIPFLIWGPSDGSGAAEKVAGNSVFEPVSAVPGGKFAKGPYPLVVLFHGTSGNYRSMGWLGRALAAQGMLVVVANHPGSTTMQVTQQSMMHTWNQAKDGSFLIDWMLASKDFAPLIDQRKIVSAGFSLGGYSALAIAGVELRLAQLQKFCKKRPNSETCKLFGDELYGPLAENSDQDQHLGDERIVAAVSLAPGFVPAMSRDSISRIDLPVLLIAGTQDEMLPINRHARALAGKFKKGTYLELSNASHFSFLGLCTEQAPKILAEEEAEFLCHNPHEGDRKEIHALTVNLISSFLGLHKVLTE